MSLSAEAIEICGRHYKTCWKGNGCHKCPIQSACASGAGSTEQDLKTWQLKVNEAAAIAAQKDGNDNR